LDIILNKGALDTFKNIKDYIFGIGNGTVPEFTRPLGLCGPHTQCGDFGHLRHVTGFTGITLNIILTKL